MAGHVTDKHLQHRQHPGRIKPEHRGEARDKEVLGAHSRRASEHSLHPERSGIPHESNTNKKDYELTARPSAQNPRSSAWLDTNHGSKAHPGMTTSSPHNNVGNNSHMPGVRRHT